MTTIVTANALFEAADIPPNLQADSRERLAVLVQRQQSDWAPDAPGSWVVLPTDTPEAPFVLVANDSEGARRGREVLRSFVGPAVGELSQTPVRTAPDSRT